MFKKSLSGKFGEHDVTVTTISGDKSYDMIADIEREALEQVPLTPAMLEIFYELRAKEFFVPYAPITEPATGGLTPNRWHVRASYRSVAETFSKHCQGAPFWIRDISDASNIEMKRKKFAKYLSLWSKLFTHSIASKSIYHLHKLIHDEVTKNGTKPIIGYNAPTPLEVLENIRPEKYKPKIRAS
jgi:hypothetical protein